MVSLLLPHPASLHRYLSCTHGGISSSLVKTQVAGVCGAHPWVGLKDNVRKVVLGARISTLSNAGVRQCRDSTSDPRLSVRNHGDRILRLSLSDRNSERATPIAAEAVTEGSCSDTVEELCPNRTQWNASGGLAHIVSWGLDVRGASQPPLATYALLASLLPLAFGENAHAATEVATTLAPGSDFQNGFASAFLLIFFSEIGDKTFFIAALLATRQNIAAVFGGTFGALALMTLISVGLGRFFHYLDEFLPFNLGDNQLPLDDIAAAVLLVYFGVTTLLDASSMDGSKTADEQQEAELAIAGLGTDGSGVAALAGTVAATFALVFVAEWGDKSFFSTIALAAASSPLGVVSGAVAGHAVATLIAVLGGSFIGSSVSEKAVAYIGGILFLVFAGVTIGEIFGGTSVF